MSKRKFFRTLVRVEVLSEDHPAEFDDLEDLAYSTNEGPYVGRMLVLKPDRLTGKEAADQLYRMGSEPGFFMLDDNGEDVE